MMLAIGAFVNFSGRGTQTQQLAESGSESVAPTAPNNSSGGVDSESAASSEVVQIPETQAPSSQTSSNSGTNVAEPAANVTSPAPSVSPSPFSQSALDKVFDSSKSDVTFAKASVTSDGVQTPTAYRAVASQGIYTDFVFDYDAKIQFTNLELALFIGDKPYFAVPELVETVSGVDAFGLEHVVFYGKATSFTDRAGKVYLDPRLTSATVRLEVVILKDRSGIATINLDVLRN
jgi:hypothetical protein